LALAGSAGDWRKLHNEELYDLCCSQSIISVIIKKDEMGWTCGMCGAEVK
jgi:hypothetical protein